MAHGFDTLCGSGESAEGRAPVARLFGHGAEGVRRPDVAGTGARVSGEASCEAGVLGWLLSGDRPETARRSVPGGPIRRLGERTEGIRRSGVRLGGGARCGEIIGGAVGERRRVLLASHAVSLFAGLACISVGPAPVIPPRWPPSRLVRQGRVIPHPRRPGLYKRRTEPGRERARRRSVLVAPPRPRPLRPSRERKVEHPRSALRSVPFATDDDGAHQGWRAMGPDQLESWPEKGGRKARTEDRPGCAGCCGDTRASGTGAHIQ